VKRAVARLIIRPLLALHIAGVAMLRRVRRPRPEQPGPIDILLTGTFHSDAWIAAHLGPLSASPHCARVRMVATDRVPAMPNVIAIYPPQWLVRVAGRVGARLATFVWVALRTRPDVVGGFHLLINGLVAGLAAAAAGARSLYFCVGGPTELAGGGFAGENRYFAALGTADPVVERQLLRAAVAFDEIVTMGTRAASFFRERGAARVHVIGGAIDARFQPSSSPPEFDLIFVGRLVPIKRVDRLIRAIAIAARTRPGVRAVIVGDGPLHAELKALAVALGIADRITFAGRQDDVAAWLRRSRLFTLTSASEGVALSLMEATMCGLPSVVPAVGDLEDVVCDGANGIVLRKMTDESLAAAFVRLLQDTGLYARFREETIARSARLTPSAVTALWTSVLRRTPSQNLAGVPAASPTA
jgi:glycosyltransferase involved in cell wall biosynthesis